jgi:hypothetical protein
MFDACQVPEQSRQKVFSGTLARILGIRQPAAGGPA